ncbi:MAG: NUDIX domain-containing protein [Candidatus Paceibacterota bacterium]
MDIAKPIHEELHRIVTTTIIYNEGRYLITKRAPHKKVHPGKWTVPGGGLEVNDYINTPPSTKGAPQWYGALEKSLRREIKEEVGLEIDKPEFLVDLTFIRPDGIPVIVFSYFAKYLSGEVKMDEDTVDFKWVTVEEAKEYDLIDGIWGEIRDVDEILNKRK